MAKWFPDISTKTLTNRLGTVKAEVKALTARMAAGEDPSTFVFDQSGVNCMRQTSALLSSSILYTEYLPSRCCCELGWVAGRMIINTQSFRHKCVGDFDFRAARLTLNDAERSWR